MKFNNTSKTRNRLFEVSVEEEKNNDEKGMAEILIENVCGSREVVGSLTNTMSDGSGHWSQVPPH
jgi:hypothetical protein